MIPHHGTFQCVVIAPSGKMLECKVSSVVFPAHDGYVGIWHNHMPMFCKLGLGIMEANCTPLEEGDLPRTEFLLIDGGFALVNSNLLRIIAYDAVYLRDVKPDKFEHILEKAKRKLAGVHAPQHRQHEIKKIALLSRLAKMSGIVKAGLAEAAGQSYAEAIADVAEKD